MKKIISLLLVLVMTFALVGTTSAEGSTPTFVVSEETAAPGDTVRVPINIQNNTGVASIQLSVHYDDSVLEWIDVEEGEFHSLSWYPRLDNGYFAWFNGVHNVEEDGLFATLVFKVKEDAPAGDTPVTVTYEEDDVFDENDENVYFDIQAGKVTVLGPAYYLIGTMTDWQVNEAYKFVENPNATGEYMLDTTLAVGDEFKAVSATGTTTNTWYPDGTDNNYVVDEAHSGNVTVYFRPDYTGGSDWHYNCLYIVARPTFKTQSLVLSGQIGLKFYVDLSMLSDEEKSASYMTFAVVDTNNTEFITNRADYNASLKNSKGYNAFTCLVSPIRMADTIKATLHYGEKTVERTYSIKQYLLSYDNNKDLFNAKLQTLTEALADYGHYMQLFLADVNGFTIGEDYADMDKFYKESYDIDAVKTALAQYALEKEDNTNGDIENVTVSVSVGAAPDLKVKFTVKSGYSGQFTVKVGSKEVTPEYDNGVYEVKVENVSAHLLGRASTITVTTDNGTCKVKASVLSYFNQLLAGGTYASDPKAQNAAASIYYYYDAAYAYKYGN